MYLKIVSIALNEFIDCSIQKQHMNAFPSHTFGFRNLDTKTIL